tara:strand:- start:139823 stop:140173 length:351 start_codon:yes stop_codon:yes gene_type:complete
MTLYQVLSSDMLMNVLMGVEFYVALASLVSLFVKHEDYRLYPIPMWTTTRYATVLVCFWPALLVALPFLRYKNRNRTAESVRNEIKKRNLARNAAMFRHHGMDFTADLLEGKHKNL